MTDKQELRIHFGFWTVFVGMNLYSDWILDRNFNDLWSVLQFIAFQLVQITVFYMNYSWICKKTVPTKKWGLLAAEQVFLLIMFPTLRHLLEEVLIFEITGQHNYSEKSLLTTYYFYDNSYYAIRMILFSLVFFFIKTIWNTNFKMNELLLQKKQAELQNLKNQLSPHFLFNTLNSFYADLMDTNPQTAADVLKLSDMLRYVTYESESDRVTVDDEVIFIQNYIALFSRRFDNKLAVNFQHSVHNGKAGIPSLLLINFVENAFKHGITTEADKQVNIRLETNENKLNFTVENYFEENEHYDEKGIGYKNVHRRLQIIFPDKYELKINRTDEKYQIKLQIPLL